MLLVAIGVLFGVVVLLWCFVLNIVHRDSAWGGYRIRSASDPKAGPTTHRSHVARHNHGKGYLGNA
jgi:hypothetical protein